MARVRQTARSSEKTSKKTSSVKEKHGKKKSRTMVPVPLRASRTILKYLRRQPEFRGIKIQKGVDALMGKYIMEMRDHLVRPAFLRVHRLRKKHKEQCVKYDPSTIHQSIDVYLHGQNDKRMSNFADEVIQESWDGLRKLGMVRKNDLRQQFYEDVTDPMVQKFSQIKKENKRSPKTTVTEAPEKTTKKPKKEPKAVSPEKPKQAAKEKKPKKEAAARKPRKDKKKSTIIEDSDEEAGLTKQSDSNEKTASDSEEEATAEMESAQDETLGKGSVSEKKAPRAPASEELAGLPQNGGEPEEQTPTPIRKKRRIPVPEELSQGTPASQETESEKPLKKRAPQISGDRKEAAETMASMNKPDSDEKNSEAPEIDYGDSDEELDIAATQATSDEPVQHTPEKKKTIDMWKN